MPFLEKQPVADTESKEARTLGVIALIVLATWGVVALGLSLYFLSALLVTPRVPAPVSLVPVAAQPLSPASPR